MFLDCGNGKQDAGEECDDKSIFNGDGCNESCQVEDGWTCTTPTDVDPSVCEENVSPEAATAAVASQAVIAGVAFVSIGASAFSGSSPGGLFQSINFMQLYMFLILLRVHLPKKIKDYIIANDLFNFDIGIPGLRSIPVLKSLLSIFKVKHLDEALHSLGVDSVSTFYNLFDHLVIFMVIVVIHLIF